MHAYRIYQHSKSDDSPHSERGGIVQVHTSHFQHISVKSIPSVSILKVPKLKDRSLAKVFLSQQSICQKQFGVLSPGKKETTGLICPSSIYVLIEHTVVHLVLDLFYRDGCFLRELTDVPPGAFQ